MALARWDFPAPLVHALCVERGRGEERFDSMTCGTPISLFVDMKFGGFCFGPAAGVEEICWANKNRGEHLNPKWEL